MRNIVRISISPLFLALLALWSAPAHAADVLEQLRDCARTENNAARAECYEVLGRQVLAEDTADMTAKTAVTEAEQIPEEKPAEPQQDQPAALPDDIGGGKFSDGTTSVESYSGTLTRCQRASDRKWFYVFNNGQIWKQVDTRKLRHKDCSGEVIIIKDGFGFKMKMPGVKGMVRVRRHR